MRSYFELDFHGSRINPHQMGTLNPRLGQFGELATIASGLLQAGSAVYGSVMNQRIAKMQKRTQEEIQARQQAAADARAAAENPAPGAPLTPAQAAQKVLDDAKILGVDRNVVIVGGIGVAIALGVLALFAGKSSGAAPATQGKAA